MPLTNPWWETKPGQCYWLEITDRQDLGADLLSPKTGTGGRPTPGYESMVHVKEADIVLHYWQQSGQEPAIVSWSVAIGTPFTSSITWTPHGRNGNKAPASRRSAWQVPLGEMTDFSRPITLTELRDAEPTLKALSSELQSLHGTPLYFPFSFYRKSPLRAAQSYLTKFPMEILEIFPVLKECTTAQREIASPGTTSPTPRQRTSGYINDSKLRKAIEIQAMNQATRYLEDEGFSVADVSANQPYDLHASRGGCEIAVEVKGSTGVSTTVELTIGEVTKAQDSLKAMLIVVDQIMWAVNDDVITTGDGQVRVWHDWKPEDDRLQPIRFRYLLPPL